jgi:uncharacterized Tic20 family protein
MNFSPETIPAAPSSDDRLWATLAHASGPAVALLTAGIAGLFSFVAPLVIWLVQKDESAFVDDQGKEATNFQFTILILYLAAGALVLLTCGMAWPLLVVVLPLIVVLQIVFAVVAAAKAYGGHAYRYPISIRFIK